MTQDNKTAGLNVVGGLLTIAIICGLIFAAYKMGVLQGEMNCTLRKMDIEIQKRKNQK